MIQLTIRSKEVATNILKFNFDWMHLLISIQQSKICPNNCASPQNSHSAQWQSNYLEIHAWHIKWEQLQDWMRISHKKCACVDLMLMIHYSLLPVDGYNVISIWYSDVLTRACLRQGSHHEWWESYLGLYQTVLTKVSAYTNKRIIKILYPSNSFGAHVMYAF